jgi:N-acetylmuramoyl-L-alanine amidase
VASLGRPHHDQKGVFRLKMKFLCLSMIGVVLATLLIGSTPAYAWSYQVKKGDSLYLISQRYGTGTPQEIQKTNKLESSLILAGSSLWIPDKGQPKQRRNHQDSLHLLARLINGEARGESFTGQVAVGAVILNRIKSGKFPDTITGNVFMPSQFESVSNGEIWQPLTGSCIKAAKAALSGWDPTNGALYFYNPSKIHSKTNWIWTRTTLTQIGNHIFAI